MRSPASELPRVTVPLFYVDFDSTERQALADGVCLAELNAREAERVRSYHGLVSNQPLPSPMHRLEILFEKKSEPMQAAEAERRFRRAMRLLTCASRLAN